MSNLTDCSKEQNQENLQPSPFKLRNLRSPGLEGEENRKNETE